MANRRYRKRTDRKWRKIVEDLNGLIFVFRMAIGLKAEHPTLEFSVYMNILFDHGNKQFLGYFGERWGVWDLGQNLHRKYIWQILYILCNIGYKETMQIVLASI